MTTTKVRARPITIFIIATVLVAAVRASLSLSYVSKDVLGSALTISEIEVIYFSVIVVAGVVGETKEGPWWKARHTLFAWWVALGVAGEAIADGEIFSASSSLQNISDQELKVAAKHATARRLPEGSSQAMDVSRTLVPFAGLSTKIISYIMRALHKAGLKTPYKWERASVEELGATESGIIVVGSPDEVSGKAAAALRSKSHDLGFCVGPGHLQDPDKLKTVGSGTMLVFVGYKNTLGDCE